MQPLTIQRWLYEQLFEVENSADFFFNEHLIDGEETRVPSAILGLDSLFVLEADRLFFDLILNFWLFNLAFKRFVNFPWDTFWFQEKFFCKLISKIIII